MASHHVQQQENLSTFHTSKPASYPTTIPGRAPLSSLPTNALSPRKQQQVAGQKRAHSGSQQKSPLKRSSISILDSEKGFTYFSKRRRISTDSPDFPTPTNGLYAEVTPPLPGAISKPSSLPSNSSAQHTSNKEKQTPRAPKPLSVAAQELAEQSSEDESGGSRDGSQHSFTSLINYDPSSQTSGVTPKVGSIYTPASQRGAFISALPPRSHHLSSQTPSQTQHRSNSQGLLPPFAHATPQQKRRAAGAIAASAARSIRPDYVATRAETLRLRLRIAVYKVLTGQTFVPFTRLRAFRAPEGMGRTAGLEGTRSRNEGHRRGKGKDTVGGAAGLDGTIDGRTHEDMRRESSGEETIVGDV
ncbi:hypothetical protein BDZ85DRAFT_262403 [Elsinoe ampelina]|uniref:Uncharacterized protein n=1 Tax=Elsinoe ampelina TaxID=302913 RepID=A0A6A6GDS5_9PEZI|nr:hypothetical protein BDZ85DRAFT_262403 [Elsinoe ampelina]